jgi:hypothetical protein
MDITLTNGEAFSIASLSRTDAKAMSQRERALDRTDEDAVNDHVDAVLHAAYGEATCQTLSESNRDTLAVYHATVAFTYGATEEAIKNLFRSGNGSPTQTEQPTAPTAESTS